MILPDNCKEIFLEGVTDAYLYPMEESKIPVPFNMAQILQINNCKFPEPALHIATMGDDYVMADSITAKVTMSKVGYGTQYAFDISANIVAGHANVREAYFNIRKKECYVVLKKVDGSFVLCYTLPGTFLFSSTATTTLTDNQCTVQVSLKSSSEFIPITII